MSEEDLTKLIVRFFGEAAGAKLEDRDSDGWLYDHDSKWGFKPSELAKRILAAMDEEVAKLYYGDAMTFPDAKKDGQ